MPLTPTARYAQVATDVHIAYAANGAGAPLVIVPAGPWDTLQISAGVSAWHAWQEQLASRHLLVRYDARGAGLSSGASAGAGLQVQVADLCGLLDYLQLGRVALYAAQAGGPTAIAFTARHPERVTHLVLWCTYARGSDYYRSSHSQALHGMLEKDWTLFLKTIAHAELGWSIPETASQMADQMLSYLTPQALAAHDAMARTVDVTGLLSQVQAPTLVVHRRQITHPLETVARDLAGSIPHAKLAVLNGDSVAPFVGDVTAGLSLLEDFLAQEERPVTASAYPAQLVEPLSEREREVLALLVAGQSNQEIARSMFVTVGTVKTRGWLDPVVLGGFCVALVLGALFAAWELHVAQPLLDVRLFGHPAFSAGTAAIAIATLALTGLTFLLTQYLQIVRHYLPLDAGVRMLPLTLGFMVGAGISHRLLEKLGARTVVTSALLLIAGSLLAISYLAVDSAYWLLAMGLSCFGVGLGSATVPSTDAVMGEVPGANAGVGSAVNDAARQVGAALGVAALGSALNSAYGAQMAGATTRLPAAAAALATNSLGGAMEVATRLGGQAGMALQGAADAAYMSAFATATHVGVALVLGGTIFVFMRLPGLNRQLQPMEGPGNASPERSDALRQLPLGVGKQWR
jgi:pimeloyl-ACP methyl ester carboxylesterase